MTSIGPRIPSPKRKRSASPDARPAKRRNSQEINLDGGSDSDCDSDVGPALPASINHGAKTDVGASLPSTAQDLALPANTEEINLDGDKDDGAAASDSDSDSSDDFTPALPNSIKPTIGPSLPPDTTAAAPVATRDEWMLAPPTSSGYQERDTTKIRSRKFAAKPSSSGDKSVSAIWTETPEQKLQRQRDALLGKTTETPTVSQGPSREQDERDRKIAAAIDATRGKSLYEEHSHGRKVDDDDDPSKRAFDREKDMAIGGKIGTAKRKELVAKSAGFGNRFQKGSYL